MARRRAAPTQESTASEEQTPTNAPVRQPRGNAARQAELARRRDERTVLQEATRGPASPLPFADVFAAMSPVPLDGLRVFTGASALGEICASGAAGDGVLAFSDEAPDLDTVAHEVGHYIQSETAGGTGSAEGGADAFAEQVRRGQHPGAVGGALSRSQVALKPDVELQKKATAGAKALRKAFSGTGTDESAVVGVLQQEPAIVRAVRTEYDTNHNTHYKKGLVYDLQQEFTGIFESTSSWNLITALLQRAGITPPKGSEQNFAHQGADDISGMSIVATPQQKAVAPGTQVEYSVQQPASVSDPASRWTYQWYRLNEADAATGASRDTYEIGPTTANWSMTWDLTGVHRVMCRVQFISSQGGAQTPTTVEFQQEVKTVDQMAKAGFSQATANDFSRFRAGLAMTELQLTKNGVQDQDFGKGPAIKNSGPNPAVPGMAPNLRSHNYALNRPSAAAKSFHWYALCQDWKYMATQSYHGFRKTTWKGQPAYDLGTGPSARWIIADRNVYTIVCDELDGQGVSVGAGAQYRQVVHSKEDQQKVDQWDNHIALVDEMSKTIEPDKRVGMKTTYVNEETGTTAAPALFIGPDKDNPGRIKLLDLTPGVPRSEYGGSTVDAAIADFVDGNSYPVGQMELEVPANNAGVSPARKTIQTKGQSTWAQWSSRLGWTSLGLAVLGIGLTLAPVPGARVAAAAVFLSAATGAAAGGLSFYEQVNRSEVSGVNVAIDILGIAGSLIGAGGAFRALQSGKALTLANRAGQFVIYGGFAADGAQGLLLAVDSIAQIADILEDGSLSEGDKIDRIVRLLAHLALTGALIVLSSQQLKKQAPLEPMSIKSSAGKTIGDYQPGSRLEIISRKSKLHGGNTIELDSNRTTTVTGTLKDTNTVATRGTNADGSLNGITKMGENSGGVNILRSPQWAKIQEKYKTLLTAGKTTEYWQAVCDEFWETVNRPWLDAAIKRGDQFRFVSNPASETALYVTQKNGRDFVLDGSGQKILSIFGREVEYLKKMGYTFLPDGTAVRK